MNRADPNIAALLEIAAGITGRTEDQIVADVEAKQRASRRKMMAANMRFAQALAKLDSMQVDKVEQLTAQGYRVISVWTARHNGKVAVTLQKDQVWNPAKGRITAKLTVVYPGGKLADTFERTISIDIRRFT